MWLGYFLLTFFFALMATPGVGWLMRRFGVVDEPDRAERKIHTSRIPLGGGLAIFLSFFVILWGVSTYTDLLKGGVADRHLLALFVGSTILMIGGFLDDKYGLAARVQIWFPILAALTLLIVGLRPAVISNPFGGVISLEGIRIPLDGFGHLVLLADVLTFCWLTGMMFTTKVLDGLDGLVTGVVIIGAIILFLVTRQGSTPQPDVALLVLLFIGACLGFLVWNFNPARIFLGEGGSLFLGYVLAVLAIMAEGKIATTLLVMGIPAIDVIRVMIQRLRQRRSVFLGDREHLHFKLIESGLSHRQAVFLLYAMSLLFGIIALLLQREQRLVALILGVVLMLLMAVWLSRRDKRSGPDFL